MKKATKVLCLALVLAQAVAMASCGNDSGESKTTSEDKSGSTSTSTSTSDGGEEEESKYPSYLNMDSAYPIVKEGEKPVTLKVLTGRVDANSSTDISEIRWTPFAEELLNVKFELEDANENASERISLMFATDDLPDMIWGMPITGGNMVTYGKGEGMLMDFSQYLNEEMMPNAYALSQQEDTAPAFNACKLNSGEMYTLPTLYSVNPLDNSTLAGERVFINKNWLEGVGRTEAPKTLDDFMTMLREFRDQDPMGKGADNTPMLGVSDLMYSYIWNALGFNSVWGYGYSYDLYNNELVMPCLTEQYREFVTLFNTMFNEGLISPDFFTMDDTTMRAYAVEGNCGVLADWAPFLSCPDTFDEWISVSPLTSNYRETPEALQSRDYGTGAAFASATSEYPEVIARFYDYLFTPDGSTNFYNGPAVGQTDVVEGTWTMVQDEDGNWVDSWPLVEDGTYSSSYEVKYQIGSIEQHICGTQRGNGEEIITGHAKTLKDPDLTNPDTFYRYTVDQAFGPYLTNVRFPVAYLTEEQSNRSVDIGTVIQNYVKQESAKFIAGERPLEEVDAFYDEVAELGSEEYLDIYRDVYSTFLAVRLSMM